MYYNMVIVMYAISMEISAHQLLVEALVVVTPNTGVTMTAVPCQTGYVPYNDPQTISYSNQDGNDICITCDDSRI